MWVKLEVIDVGDVTKSLFVNLSFIETYNPETMVIAFSTEGGGYFTLTEESVRKLEAIMSEIVLETSKKTRSMSTGPQYPVT